MTTKQRTKAIERLLDAKDSLLRARLLTYNLKYSAKLHELVQEIDALIYSLSQESQNC